MNRIGDNLQIPSILQFLLGAFLAALGAAGLSGRYVFTCPQPIYFAVAPLTLQLDGLSGIFLSLLGAITMSVALFSAPYLQHLQGRIHFRIYWICLFLFISAMALVLLSANAPSFIIFWEIMSLSSAVLVVADYRNDQAQRSALIYLASTRVATAFLVGGFLWLYTLSGSWNFSDWHAGSAAALIPALLIAVGVCIKAGIWPFHIWLPYAHPAAPTPVSAFMSGIMIKIAIYAALRILLSDSIIQPTICWLFVVLGLISSFWGILFAFPQHDLKKLLAYSSVENIGLIVLAVGLAAYGKASQNYVLASCAIVAALYHSINHGLFKSLLFLGAGVVDTQTHTRDLQLLGGLGKKLPVTAFCFLIGSVSICALPPLNGFASKWMIYQSFFNMAISHKMAFVVSACFVGFGVLSMVGALAIACFTKAFATTFGGRARSHAAANASEDSFGMLAAQVVLATSCVVLGILAPSVVNVLQSVASIILRGSETTVVFTVPSWQLGLALVILFSSIYYFTLARKTTSVKYFDTWECGFGSLSPRMQVNPGSFSQPIARIFRLVLQYTNLVAIKGTDRRHFPESITVEASTKSLLEQRFYLPILAVLEWSSKAIAKLQTGSIHMYLLYMMITLLILLVVGTRT